MRCTFEEGPLGSPFRCGLRQRIQPEQRPVAIPFKEAIQTLIKRSFAASSLAVMCSIKTHAATVLGVEVCRRGYRVGFTTATSSSAAHGAGGLKRACRVPFQRGRTTPSRVIPIGRFCGDHRWPVLK